MGLWGASAFLATLVPRDLARATAIRLGPLRAAAIVLAVATTILALPLEAAAIGDGWADALAPGTLAAVLFETSVGRAWQCQMAAAVLLAVTVLAPVRIRPAMTATTSGLALAALALTGHAAMHEGWLGLVHRGDDALHLLAGGAWFGALVPLPPILEALDDPRCRREAGIALRRFSRAGHAAVALVLATGILNTMLVLGRWPTGGPSPYQMLLAVKIGLAAMMTILAVVNRYGVVPSLADDRRAALRMIRAVTIAEIALGLIVIGLVSVFGLLEPG